MANKKLANITTTKSVLADADLFYIVDSANPTVDTKTTRADILKSAADLVIVKTGKASLTVGDNIVIGGTVVDVNASAISGYHIVGGLGVKTDNITEATSILGVIVSGTTGVGFMSKTTAYPNGLIKTTNAGIAFIGDGSVDVNGTYVTVDDTNSRIELNSLSDTVFTSPHINMPLAKYLNDAAAVLGGLVQGDLYQVTGTGVVQIVQ